MPNLFSFSDFPSHLKDLAEPILSFLNDHAENLPNSRISDYQNLLNSLILITTSILTERTEETPIPPNIFVLIGRLAQELDYPPDINEFFRSNDDQTWLTPFIADWYLYQDKPQDARHLLDSHFEKIKTEIESLTNFTADNTGKIQAYLESLRVKALIQLQSPDKSTFTLTLRKAMTFLEKLNEENKELKNTWASYALRFSAIQLSAELAKPDLDIIEAIERNVGEILPFTEDTFSKLQFWIVLSKALASLKNYHKLEEVLINAWESASESMNIRLTEEIMSTFAWFTLLRLDTSKCQEILTSLYEKLTSIAENENVPHKLLKNAAFSSVISVEKPEYIVEIAKQITPSPSDLLTDSFFKLHLMTHLRTIKEDELTKMFQEYRSRVITHKDKWLEICLAVLELKRHVLNENIGKFKERLEEIRNSDLYNEMMNYPFIKFQLLTFQAIAELCNYWLPLKSFSKENFTDVLQQLTTILSIVYIPELESLALQLKTMNHLIKEDFDKIFSLAKEIKEFNKDLLKNAEKKRYDTFIAQIEWLEREIAINETLYLSPLAEPPSPDSAEALRVLFFNDDYKIITSFLGIVARMLQQLFAFDFTLLIPNTLSFEMVSSFFAS